MSCVLERARSRLLFACSTVIQHRTKRDAIHQFSMISHSVFARAHSERVLSRQDFFTSLKIYHLINFMTSYFSLLSSCLVHIIIIFLRGVCVCARECAKVCFQMVCHSHIYIHLKARKTFPIRCSVLYVIFFEPVVLSALFHECFSENAHSTKSFSQKSWFNVQAWPRQKLTLVFFAVMLSMSFHSVCWSFLFSLSLSLLSLLFIYDSLLIHSVTKIHHGAQWQQNT